METFSKVEKKESDKIINTSNLEIGCSYLAQFFNIGFVGKLNSISKRHSQNWHKEIVTIKKKEIEIDVLKLAKPQYDVLVFTAEEQKLAEQRGIVKKMFNRTNEEQFYFTDSLLFQKNVIKEVIHDWAILKIIDVSRMKISNSNLAVTMKIAKSMMIKAGYNDYSIELVSNKIREKAIEIIDIKQYEWDKIMESQANQLPFD